MLHVSGFMFQEVMAEKKNGLATLIIMIAAGVVVILIAFYFLYMQYAAPGGQTQQQNTAGQTIQTDPTANWNTASNNEMGFSFKYPSGFFDAGHEPSISITDCNYQVFPGQCPNMASSPTQVVNKLVVNGVNYCLYQNGDAGAGHQYYYDYYLTVKNQKCLEVELDSATTTCENYLPLETGNTQQAQNYNTCIAQRQNRPTILNQIINTFTFTR